MSAVAKVELFHPRNKIAEKVSILENTSLETLYTRAENAVAELEPAAFDALHSETERLRGAFDQLIASSGDDAAILLEMQLASGALRDLAGTFEFELISEIASSLYILVAGRERANGPVREVVGVHVAAIEAVLRAGLKNDGGGMGATIVSSLQKAVAKYRQTR